MIIVYYSQGSPFPALLASMKHCRPALSPEQAWLSATAWMEAHYRPERRSYFLKLFNISPEADSLYLMSAGVPGAVLKRTLEGFCGLIINGKKSLLVSSFPPWCRRWERSSSIRRKGALWIEIEALVEQTKLQVELIKR